MKRTVTLVDLYEDQSTFDQKIKFLYHALSDRRPEQYISFRMPTKQEHWEFVISRPYEAWYMVKALGWIGSIYLTRQNEIGIFLETAYQRDGYGRAAVNALMERHGDRRYLANINPANTSSIRFFEDMGFRRVQYTYAWEGKK